MTKRDLESACASDEIEITPKMIEAGVTEWRECRYGDSGARVVEAIYLAMEIERRALG